MWIVIRRFKNSNELKILIIPALIMLQMFVFFQSFLAQILPIIHFACLPNPIMRHTVFLHCSLICKSSTTYISCVVRASELVHAGTGKQHIWMSLSRLSVCTHMVSRHCEHAYVWLDNSPYESVYHTHCMQIPDPHESSCEALKQSFWHKQHRKHCI